MRTSLRVGRMALVLAAGLLLVPVDAGAQKVVKKERRSVPSAPTKPCPRSCADRCLAVGGDECRLLEDGDCEACSGEGPSCVIANAALMMRFGYACREEDDVALSKRVPTSKDPCGAAGTWIIECEPEPDPASCPLAGQVPGGTLSATATVPVAVAQSGGPITVTATSGPFAGKARVTGQFDQRTCEAVFQTHTPQCGAGSSRYRIQEGTIKGTRTGGTTCCSALRACSGTVNP